MHPALAQRLDPSHDIRNAGWRADHAKAIVPSKHGLDLCAIRVHGTEVRQIRRQRDFAVGAGPQRHALAVARDEFRKARYERIHVDREFHRPVRIRARNEFPVRGKGFERLQRRDAKHRHAEIAPEPIDEPIAHVLRLPQIEHADRQLVVTLGVALPAPHQQVGRLTAFEPVTEDRVGKLAEEQLRDVVNDDHARRLQRAQRRDHRIEFGRRVAWQKVIEEHDVRQHHRRWRQTQVLPGHWAPCSRFELREMGCGHARNRAAVGHRHDRQAVATLRYCRRTACAAKRLQGLAERRRAAERKPGILQHHFQADAAEGVEQ